MFDLMPFENRNTNLFDYFDKMNRDFFGNFEKEMFTCRTDIIDQGESYLLNADMPGFKKEDIHIDVDGERLTISAEHKEETNNSKDSFIRRERKYGSLSRSFDISGINPQNISASYNNGVLQLQLPKKQNATPPSHRIEIKD